MSKLDKAAGISALIFTIVTLMYTTSFPELLPYWRISLICAFILVGFRNYKNNNKPGLIAIGVCTFLYILLDWIFGVFK